MKSSSPAAPKASVAERLTFPETTHVPIRLIISVIGSSDFSRTFVLKENLALEFLNVHLLP
jgi:hypothetical protein